MGHGRGGIEAKRRNGLRFSRGDPRQTARRRGAPYAVPIVPRRTRTRAPTGGSSGPDRHRRISRAHRGVLHDDPSPRRVEQCRRGGHGRLDDGLAVHSRIAWAIDLGRMGARRRSSDLTLPVGAGVGGADLQHSGRSGRGPRSCSHRARRSGSPADRRCRRRDRWPSPGPRPPSSPLETSACTVNRDPSARSKLEGQVATRLAGRKLRLGVAQKRDESALRRFTEARRWRRRRAPEARPLYLNCMAPAAGRTSSWPDGGRGRRARRRRSPWWTRRADRHPPQDPAGRVADRDSCSVPSRPGSAVTAAAPDTRPEGRSRATGG